MLLKSEESKSPEVQSQEPDAEGVHVCWPRLCHSCVVKVFRFEQSVGFTLIPKNLCTITLSTIYLSPNNLDTLNHQSFATCKLHQSFVNCMHVGGSLICQTLWIFPVTTKNTVLMAQFQMINLQL